MHAERMKTPPAVPASIDAYLAAQSDEARPILQRIRAIVHEEAPLATETISYRMPAFRQGGVLLYFAAFRQHIGVYPPVSGDAALLRALAPYRGPKGNLSFPFAQAMPYALIRRVVRCRVRQAAAENAAKNAARAAARRTP
jgi:uncharacterized protein YdhG (YjbR/CyaY superfamily)